MATPALPNVIPEPTVRLLLKSPAPPVRLPVPVMVGDVKVLFVRVSVVVLPINVSVVVGNVRVTFPAYAEWAADCRAV